MVSLSVGEMFLKCVEVQILLQFENGYGASNASRLLYLAMFVPDKKLENYQKLINEDKFISQYGIPNAASDFVHGFLAHAYTVHNSGRDWYREWGIESFYEE